MSTVIHHVVPAARTERGNMLTGISEKRRSIFLASLYGSPDAPTVRQVSCATLHQEMRPLGSGYYCHPYGSGNESIDNDERDDASGERVQHKLDLRPLGPCLYCGVTFTHNRTPAIVSFDASTQTTKYWGNFCCTVCAVGSIMEQNRHDRAYRIMCQIRFAEQVLKRDVTAEWIPPPPRICFKYYGGHIDSRDMWAHCANYDVRILEGNFVPYSVVVEVSRAHGTLPMLSADAATNTDTVSANERGNQSTTERQHASIPGGVDSEMEKDDSGSDNGGEKDRDRDTDDDDQNDNDKDKDQVTVWNLHGMRSTNFPSMVRAAADLDAGTARGYGNRNYAESDAEDEAVTEIGNLHHTTTSTATDRKNTLSLFERYQQKCDNNPENDEIVGDLTAALAPPEKKPRRSTSVPALVGSSAAFLSMAAPDAVKSFATARRRKPAGNADNTHKAPRRKKAIAPEDENKNNHNDTADKMDSTNTKRSASTMGKVAPKRRKAKVTGDYIE